MKHLRNLRVHYYFLMLFRSIYSKMILFHRTICITALSLLCHLLTINITIKPLPSDGFFTLFFTQINTITPDLLKLLFICVIIITLLYSILTLRMQGFCFLIATIIIDLSLTIAQATLMLNESIPYYICIIKLQLDPVQKINHFYALINLYTEHIIQILKDSPAVLELVVNTIQVKTMNSTLIITQMDTTQIATHAKFIVESSYNIILHDFIYYPTPIPFFHHVFYMFFVCKVIYNIIHEIPAFIQ
jgi:hypothetical protein